MIDITTSHNVQHSLTFPLQISALPSLADQVPPTLDALPTDKKVQIQDPDTLFALGTVIETQVNDPSWALSVTLTELGLSTLPNWVTFDDTTPTAPTMTIKS